MNTLEKLVQTNTDLTLYSKSVENNVEKWTRTVIEEVHWENTKAVNVIRSGILQSDSVAVFIPTYGREVPTIKPGDVIAEGIVTKVISSSYRISQLKEEYSNVVTVRSVDDYNFGSPNMHHLRIGAS